MNFKTVLILIILCTTPFSYGQESSAGTNTYKSLYKARIDLNQGTQNWAKNIASVVFDETISENEKVYEFYVSKQENDLLINSEIPMMSENENKEEGSKNCNTLKKTCRSEKCVANTLIEILGDGSRNVLIKYERKMLSVQIYYTYQDCN
jgi:hypothetical protein